MNSAPASQPLVSVVIPTHNRAKLLVRAIHSVLAQSYRNLELIVVDDASQDDTPQAVAAINDSRLRYIRHDRGRYAAGARNSGIRAARGEFVAFQDDDDVWLVEKLEKQVAALQSAPEEVGMNICGHICCTTGRIFYVGGQRAFRRLDYRVFRLGDAALIATPGWLVRRRYLEQAGLFDETIRTWEDWELSLRLAQVCRFSHVDEPLFIQDRVLGGGMSREEGMFAKSMRAVLEKHESLWQGSPDTLAHHYRVVGHYEALYGDSAEGRRWLRKALRLRPFAPLAWIVYALSLFGDGRTRRVREEWHKLRKLLKRGRAQVARSRT